jgi:DNA-binding transcriptional MerR regulator
MVLDKPIKKLYYSISEVAKWLNVTTETIRYWCVTYGIEVDRDRYGDRRFVDADLTKLKTIHFLRVKKGLTGYGVTTELYLHGWPSESVLEAMIHDFNVQYAKRKNKAMQVVR